MEVENPTRRDLVAAYRCDVAYHTQYANASKQMNKWKAEVEGGKVVRGFGAQASQLIESRIDEYENATSMHANSQARAKKGGELNTFLKSSITSLFQKQMQLLQTRSLIQFKDLLLNSVSHIALLPSMGCFRATDPATRSSILVGGDRRW